MRVHYLTRGQNYRGNNRSSWGCSGRESTDGNARAGRIPNELEKVPRDNGGDVIDRSDQVAIYPGVFSVDTVLTITRRVIRPVFTKPYVCILRLSIRICELDAVLDVVGPGVRKSQSRVTVSRIVGDRNSEFTFNRIDGDRVSPRRARQSLSRGVVVRSEVALSTASTS